VPNIKQPLYDPLTKVQLEPGTELRQNPVDDAWLLLKHRDSLQDFLDVEPAEKEYMMEWDSFILKKHISSQQYLPRAFLGFVKEKASWIVSKQSRAEEFSKHVSMLLARRAIGDDVIHETTIKINEARNAMLEAAKEAKEASKKAAAERAIAEKTGAIPVADMQPTAAAGQEKKARKKAGGCVVCGEPVPVPVMVICANKVCAYPYFAHSASIITLFNMGKYANEIPNNSYVTTDCIMIAV